MLLEGQLHKEVEPAKIRMSLGNSRGFFFLNVFLHPLQNGVIRKEKKQILHLECGVHNAFNTLLSEILLAKAIYFSEDTTSFSVIACQTTAKLVNYMLFNDKEKRCGRFTCQKKLNLSIVGKGGKRG